jgi:hypothetical protein
LSVIDEEGIEQPAVAPVARLAEEHARTARLYPPRDDMSEVDTSSDDLFASALGQTYRTSDSTPNPRPGFVVARERLV